MSQRLCLWIICNRLIGCSPIEHLGWYVRRICWVMSKVLKVYATLWPAVSMITCVQHNRYTHTQNSPTNTTPHTPIARNPPNPTHTHTQAQTRTCTDTHIHTHRHF